jgi:radical SAM superfamily enzyme YgiQ (UPF0313 family)
MNNNFQVVLINPSNDIIPESYYAPTEHLGLAYLTAVLREKGFPVKLIDSYALNLSFQETIKEAILAKPRFIGLTAEYNTIRCAMELIADFRKLLPEVHLALGGEHATYSSLEIFADSPALNSIIRGEGELTIVEVMTRLCNKEDLYDIEGVYFRDNNNEIVINKDRAAIEDLDSLPFPTRDTLEECIKRGITPALSLLTSRGCHANCSFCNASKFFNLGGGKTWRGRDPKKVVDELEYLMECYKDIPLYEVIYFSDENFVGPGKEGIKRAEIFAHEIINRKLKITFEIFCRADSFDSHEDVVKILSDAGLISALVGLESGYQNQLNTFDKGTTVDQNKKTVELFHKYNVITSSSGFLMFNPYNTLKELEENAKFLLSIGMSTLYNMSLKVLGYPGIRMINKLKSDGLTTGNFSHLNVSGYIFKDSRVGILANALSFDEEVSRKEDSSHRYIDFMMANLDKKLGQYMLDKESMDEIISLKNLLKDCKFKANLVSYNFFLKAMTLAENGWDPNIYDKYKNNYIYEINDALETLNNSFTSYIEYIAENIVDSHL